MQGASTLTINLDDHDRSLLRSGMLDQQVDLQLDGLWWRLVKVSKQGDALTLVFEDRIVSLLRKITTPRKAARAKMTRAEFALSIVREVKYGPRPGFFSPNLHVTMPIETQRQAMTASQRAKTVSQGLSAGVALTVKGVAVSNEQRTNAERCLDVANSLNASTRATLALMEAVIVESTIRNLPGGDADSRGILQVRDSTAKPMGIDNRDVEQCANAFLTRGFTGRGGSISLAAKYPNWTPGQVAQGVQGSAYPGRYDQAQTEAQKFLNAYTGGSGIGSTSSTRTATQPYQFQRGGTSGTIENSWACLQRLAQEVQWACFVADDTVYFVAEGTLIRRKPLATWSELTLGIDAIDFDIDNGKTKSDAMITARADRYTFPPGACIVLEKCGPANGRWLVSDVSRGIFDASATITLKRATKALPEPAPTTSSVTMGTISAAGVPNLGGAVDGKVQDAYAAAISMDAKRYPYVWGGGHAHVGTPDRGTGRDPGIGFDCSGSTCAILAAGQMGYVMGKPADVSGTIAARWGAPGEGQHLTVWANAVHVWMEFKTQQGDQHFGTGEYGKSWGGPGFNPLMHPKAGFTPRHWPGT